LWFIDYPGLLIQGQIDGSSSDDSNLVQIWNNHYTLTGLFPTELVSLLLMYTGEDDALSSVLLVAPSLNASLIGSGPTGAPLQPLFGDVDFKAYNIDFENRAVSTHQASLGILIGFQSNYSISQALVTDISYANASFYGCNFASYQDTWYTTNFRDR